MAIRGSLLLFSVVFILAAACGGSDGGPVRLQLKDNGTYQTDVVVRNDTGETLRDARLHLRQHNPKLGIEVVGTVTNARTEHAYDGDFWRLGDLRPGESLLFPIGLWIETTPQLKSASGLDLTIDLVSKDLAGPLTSTPLRVEAN